MARGLALGSKLTGMSRPSHQTYWWIAAGGVGAVGGSFLAAGLSASPIVWFGNLMIVAYVCGGSATAAFLSGIRAWRFPLARIDQAELSGSSDSLAQIPAASKPADPLAAATTPVAVEAAGQESDTQAPLADQRWLRLVNQLIEIIEWDTWQGNVAPFFNPNFPWVMAAFVERLQRANEWIFSRTWPPGRPELRDAIDAYGRVIADWMHTFFEHAEESSNGTAMMTEKFYKVISQNPRYFEDLAKYRHHLRLLEDLALEATRYGNYIADLVRKEIDPEFRAEEGALLLRLPYDYFKIGLVKPEFRPEDFENGQPYKDLQAFEDERASRDVSMKEEPEESGNDD
jgi:hypothetical protein